MIVIDGPEPGFHTDVMVWNNSKLRDDFERIMRRRVLAGQRRLTLYADKIYNPSVNMVPAYSLRHGALLPWMVNENSLMSKIRVTVEWTFGKIVNIFAYLDFAKQNKLQQAPVDKLFIVSALLCNVHTCMYGGQSSLYFDCPSPDVEDYLGQ